MAITVDKFLGVNNKEAPEALVAISKGRAESYLTSGVNVDITEAGRLTRRKGVTQLLTGNWHSLWSAPTEMFGFGVKDGQVFYIYPSVSGVATTATGIITETRRMVYALTPNGDVHLSNGVAHWVYSGGAVTELNQAGTYDTAAAFADQADDAAFYDSFPPVVELECAFGRLWGADADTLWYSPSFFYRRSKADTDFIPQADITLLKAVTDGLYVGTSDAVWFYGGTNPKNMKPKQVCSEGAVLGTPLSVEAEKFKIEGAFGHAAIWESTRGKVIGLGGGRVIYLTDASVSYAPGDLGASLLRESNGLTQHLSAFRATSDQPSNMRATDSAEAEVIRNGIII